MRKVILMAALAAASGVAAQASTWIASCNDGKNVQYVQTVKGNGFLYLKTATDYFQTAKLSQSFESGSLLCGAVVGNTAPGGAAMTQICIDKAHRAISLKYKNPAQPNAEAADAGVFCQATVTERATNLTER